MKYLRFLSAMALAGIVLVASSCGKDDDPQSKSRKDLLTAHAWKFSSAEPTSDFSVQLLAAFYEDAEFTFNANGTYTGLFLTLPLSGDWAFKSDETVIVLDEGGSGEQTYTIATLSETSLDLQFVDDSLTITLKFVKK